MVGTGGLRGGPGARRGFGLVERWGGGVRLRCRGWGERGREGVGVGRRGGG